MFVKIPRHRHMLASRMSSNSHCNDFVSIDIFSVAINYLWNNDSDMVQIRPTIHMLAFKILEKHLRFLHCWSGKG